MILKTEGVVLRTFDLRETSLLAVIFSKDHGKIKGVLKGIRKDPRKFGSSLDRFSVNDIVYYTYRNSDCHLISQCDMKGFFPQVRRDYRRQVAAHYMLELVDKIMPVEEENEAVYTLVMNYLNSLEERGDVERLVPMLQIKMLNLSGFRPHIDACVRCQKRVEGRARFSLKWGGLVCASCPAGDGDLVVVSPGTISSMLYVEENDWAKSLRLALTARVRRELQQVLNNFLVYHLEKRVRSAAYLRREPVEL